MKYLFPLLLLMLTGCVSAPSTVNSWLDSVTAVTITAPAQPLMFGLIEPPKKFEPMQGFMEREYAQLTAIEVNRMGERRLYLVATSWSKTRPYTQRKMFEAAFTQLELRLADRNVVLTAHEGSLAELNIGQLPMPLQLRGSDYSYFPVERADLKAIVESDRIDLAARGIATPLQYEDLTLDRGSLSDFFAQLPPEKPARAQQSASTHR
jgi:hypothetical protein